MSYEILTEDETQKMSLRELQLSICYYEYNTEILYREYERRCEQELISLPEFSEVTEHEIKSDPFASLPEHAHSPKKRGRKKKQQ